MARRSVRTARGTLVLVGEAGVLDAAEELALRRLAEGRPASGPVELAGRRAWFKGGHLRGSSRWRHAARRAFLWKPPPRLCEHANLTWLRERSFQAPEPLAAGAVVRAGLTGFQFLVTAEISGAETLRAFLERTVAAPPGTSERGSERASVLDELARETARLHAQGFVHHDLFPRNLLVARNTEPARVVFLDAWAGGPGFNLRGPAYDLGCLMLRGCELLDALEQRRFFERYAAERAAHERPIEAARFFERVRRERDALVRRAARVSARRPGEHRGLGPPAADWAPPVP